MTVKPVFSICLGDERPISDTSCFRAIRDLRAVAPTLGEAVDRAIARAIEQAPPAAQVTIFLKVDAIEAQVVPGIAPMVSVRCSGDYYLQEPV